MASIRITRDPEVAILDLGSPEKNPWSGSPDLIRDLKQQAELMYQEGTLETGYTPYPDIRDLASAADALQLSYTITYPMTERLRETEPGPGIRYEPSRDFIDPRAHEAAFAKWLAHPATQALFVKGDQEDRDGTHPFVRGTTHDEFWRDA